MAELRLLLVADGLLERDRRLRAPHDLLDLLERQVEIARDLERQRLAAELGAQLALRADDLVQLLDDMHGHADRPRLVGERPRDRLPDPPRRIRRELEALAVVELLGRAHEPDRSLLDQVEERQALVAVALRDRHDETKVRLDHLLLRTVVAALDALRKLDLLRRGEQVDLADVLEEELQRVRRDLARLCDRLLLLDLVDDGNDLDLHLLERLVELVHLPRVELELVERERDVVLRDRTGGLGRLQKIPGFLGLEDVRHGPCGSLNPTPVLTLLPSVNLLVTQQTFLRRCRTMPAAADRPP